MEDNTFKPGAVVRTFTSRKGNEVILRYPTKQDVAEMTDFMNEISREDTFISFSGEELTLHEEKEYLDEVLQGMQKGNVVKLFAFNGKRMVGNADVTRLTRRSKHVGVIGLSIKKGYREEGIGSEMLATLLEIAKQMHLQFIQLSVLHPNEHARYVYKKLGFEEVGTIPQKIHYKGELIDEIIMYKRL